MGSILDDTQDDLVTTNENVNESIREIVNVMEMVVAESSRNNEVNIIKQLTMIMEMVSEINANNIEMNNKFDQQNKNNDSLNTSLNEFKTEMKSDNIKMMREINASSVELKTEIKAEINEINNSCLLYTSRCV